MILAKLLLSTRNHNNETLETRKSKQKEEEALGLEFNKTITNYRYTRSNSHKTYPIFSET